MLPISSKPAAVDLNQSRWLAGGLLLLAVAFNLYTLWPEAVQTAPRLNDMVLHGQALQATTAALSALIPQQVSRPEGEKLRTVLRL